MLGFCRNMAGVPQSQQKNHQKWQKKSHKNHQSPKKLQTLPENLFWRLPWVVKSKKVYLCRILLSHMKLNFELALRVLLQAIYSILTMPLCRHPSGVVFRWRSELTHHHEGGSTNRLMDHQGNSSEQANWFSRFREEMPDQKFSKYRHCLN